MHSPTSPGTFSSNFLMYISVGALTNIYFSMKDSNHLDKCNFPFLHLRKLKVFISSFGLVCRYITLYAGSLGPA